MPGSAPNHSPACIGDAPPIARPAITKMYFWLHMGPVTPASSWKPPFPARSRFLGKAQLPQVERAGVRDGTHPFGTRVAPGFGLLLILESQGGAFHHGDFLSRLRRTFLIIIAVTLSTCHTNEASLCCFKRPEITHLNGACWGENQPRCSARGKGKPRMRGQVCCRREYALHSPQKTLCFPALFSCRDGHHPQGPHTTSPASPQRDFSALLPQLKHHPFLRHLGHNR